MFVNNLNIYADGENSRGLAGGRSPQPVTLLPPTEPLARPRQVLQIHMASTRRERLVEPRAGAEAIKASWRATMRSIEQSERGTK